MVERLSTGIKGLDDMIEGGFERNRVFLFTGGGGSGKSTYAASFMYSGLMSGEKALYISLEENQDIFIGNMKRLGLDFTPHLESKDFKFIHLLPEVIRDSTLGFNELNTLLDSDNYSRAVIDSITAFLLTFEKEVERRDNLGRLLELFRRRGLTVVLTSEEGYDTAQWGLSYLVDGVINLLYNEKLETMNRIRLIEVYKMRGTNHSSTKVFFKIVPNEGIIISTTGAFG
jgi:KaiC/GvpD/RAD55 family RecA-like ATPase